MQALDQSADTGVRTGSTGEAATRRAGIASPPTRLHRPRRRRSSRGVRRARRWLLGIGGFVLFFLALELISVTSGLSEQSLPRATTILGSLAGLFVDPTFLAAVGQTLYASMTGLVLASVIAIPLGVALGTWRVTYDASSALIEFMRPVPPPALIPLVLLMFGATAEMKISLVAFSAFWIVLFNAIYGVRDVDPVLKDSARVFGYSRVGVLMRISVPSAAPFIYTGIRLAATAAFLVAISAELLAGGSGGIGEWLRQYQETGTNADLVYAGAFFAGLVGLAINLVLNLGERLLFPWNISTRAMK